MQIPCQSFLRRSSCDFNAYGCSDADDGFTMCPNTGCCPPAGNRTREVLDPTKQCPGAEDFEKEGRRRIVRHERAIRQLTRVNRRSGLPVPPFVSTCGRGAIECPNDVPAYGHRQRGRRLKLLIPVDFNWHGTCFQTSAESKRCATDVPNRRLRRKWEGQDEDRRAGGEPVRRGDEASNTVLQGSASATDRFVRSNFRRQDWGTSAVVAGSYRSALYCKRLVLRRCLRAASLTHRQMRQIQA